VPAELTDQSPHARDELVLRQGVAKDVRSIPACAGRASVPAGNTELVTINPRRRGTTAHGSGVSGSLTDQSRCAREDRQNEVRNDFRVRIIPACAGRQGVVLTASGPVPINPRVRGATAGTDNVVWSAIDQSRVRGTAVGIRSVCCDVVAVAMLSRVWIFAWSRYRMPIRWDAVGRAMRVVDMLQSWGRPMTLVVSPESQPSHTEDPRGRTVGGPVVLLWSCQTALENRLFQALAVNCVGPV